MIASVAHELQHAVEVIEDESVTDERSLIASTSASDSRAALPARPAGKHSPHNAPAHRSAANWSPLPRRR